MLYLVDTSALINILNGKSSFVELLGGIPLQACALSVITIGEVLEWVVEGSKKEDEARGIFSRFRALDVDKKVCERFASVRRKLRQKGQLIDNMDLLIASTALVHKLILITGNKKHFERVKGLKLFTQDFAN